MGFTIQGSTSGNGVEADSSNNMKVALPTVDALAGKVRIMSENDPGTVTGSAALASPETDSDYRLRVALDTMLDTETFDYAAQNTGKHNYLNTTMTFAWGGGFLASNGSSISTTNTGARFRTYQLYPIVGAASLYAEITANITLAVSSNTTIDFGLFVDGGSNPYAPTDGIYFRWNNSGLFGVINNGGETTTSVFNFTPTLTRNYKFVVAVVERVAQFWIDDVLYGSIATPTGVGQPCLSASLPLAIRHSISNVGAAGSLVQFRVSDYTVSVGGYSTYQDWVLARAVAAQQGYQGQSGGTMGSTANYANSANPSALVPTNTTAAAGSLGLGGQTWETDTVAATTDCIIFSYQNPAGTTAVPGHPLLIYGVTLDSSVQTTLTGGGYVAQWCIAYGHTNVSLATGETASTKAPRRVALGQMSVASGATALAILGRLTLTLTCPIVVQPGEFVALVKKKVGTAPSGGVIAHVAAFDAVWV